MTPVEQPVQGNSGKQHVKPSAYCLLLKLRLRWTFHMFGRWIKTKRIQHPAVGVVTNLGEIATPYVTSQRGGFPNCVL